MKARNIVNNFDGLGVVWYTSANADFERGETGESSDGTQKEVSTLQESLGSQSVTLFRGFALQCTRPFSLLETT